MVTTVSCLLFGGVSGSAIADTAAIGSLVVPMMKEKGYEAGVCRSVAVRCRNPGAADAPLDPFSGLCLHFGRFDAAAFHVRGRPGADYRDGHHRGVHVVWKEVRLRHGRETVVAPGNMGRLQGCGTGADDADHHHRRHLVRDLHADRGSRGGGGLRFAHLHILLQGP